MRTAEKYWCTHITVQFEPHTQVLTPKSKNTCMHIPNFGHNAISKHSMSPAIPILCMCVLGRRRVGFKLAMLMKYSSSFPNIPKNLGLSR